MSKEKRIAALVPNVLGFSPGQRVRIEFWENFLKDAGWKIEYFQFEDESLHEVLYQQGRSLTKLTRLLGCYGKHFSQALSKFASDIIFIYREASLIGPALSERLIARQKIPIVYDIDDPVFLPYKSPVNGWASLLKFPKKTHKLFQLSTQIIAINNLIGDYAANFNEHVTIIPNCVDAEKYKPVESEKKAGQKEVKMVWIGSHSTMQNLVEIAAPIKKLQAENACPLLIIGAGNSNLDGVDVEMRQWSSETEVGDLQEGDIGLLPVNDLEWNNWKFFYKTIQYMAVGLPVVARKIGSNEEVIENGVNGFVVESEREWFDKISLLIKNPEMRRKMGENARKTVLEKYSVTSQMPRMVEIFEKVLRQSQNKN
ncbi:MAG TPA: glycosyltransferase family 4 protein [Pyrinomonadaceae bacterium]